MEQLDAVVIGAGEAGAIVASNAISAGMRVAMLYREPYGSTCVNVGCVPSKFMIHRAKVAHTVRTTQRFGISAGAPRIDLETIVAEKNEFTADHRAEGLDAARTAAGLTLIEGAARFVGPKQVAVGDRILTAEQVFIATGMRPKVPHLDGLADVPYLTNEDMMDLTDVPQHLIVLGGGYIGCELAQAYRRFGSAVTIVHSRDHLLSGEEPDVSTILERALRAEGIVVLLQTRALAVARSGDHIRVTVRDLAEVAERHIEGSHLLVAIGRTPNTDMLNLAVTGVTSRDDGTLPVDDRMATNVPGIWAVGDVNGEQPFTRVCQEEAKIAYTNAFDGADARIDRLPLGHAVFTDPEVATVGLTEAQARAQGYDVAVGLVTFDQIEKAELIGETMGLIKYVVERDSRRLLGAHVIGPDAANLVYTPTVVLRRRGTLDELATAVGIFPTLAEGMEGTARGLLRRLAPALASGPLVTVPLAADRETHGQAPANQLTRDRQDETASVAPLELVAPEPRGSMSTPSFACPACAGEFETTEALSGADGARST